VAEAQRLHFRLKALLSLFGRSQLLAELFEFRKGGWGWCSGGGESPETSVFVFEFCNSAVRVAIIVNYSNFFYC